MEKGINRVCYITKTVGEILGLDDKLTNKCLEVFSQFREDCLGSNKEANVFFLEYDSIGPVISALLLEDKNRRNTATIIFGIIMRTQRLIVEGENDKAYSLYQDMVNELKRQYQNGIKERLTIQENKFNK